MYKRRAANYHQKQQGLTEKLLKKEKNKKYLYIDFSPQLMLIGIYIVYIIKNI
jgi:hypothetical protein